MFFEEVIIWLNREQRLFHTQLANSLDDKADPLSMGLIIASFLYGIFHAAGPGHGKIVISAYLLSQAGNVRDGLKLALNTALLQGLIAIFLVYGLSLALSLVPAETDQAVLWSERASFILLMLMGLYLIVRAWSNLRHPHIHHADCGCGQNRPAKGGIFLSLGLRPCSGAILVLILAQSSGRWLAGIIAVLLMSLGTAITVGILALLSVKARDWLLGRMLRENPPLLARLVAVIALLGGIVILGLGTLFLRESFMPPHPLRI